MLNKKESNMKTTITKKSVTTLIESYRRQVAAYVRAKELPKYIANEMDNQLAEAIEEVDAGDLHAAYNSLNVYVELYSRYAAGNYTVNQPRVNTYYHHELSPNQACGFLIALGLRNAEPNFSLRLLDCMRKFEVTKTVTLNQVA
jgi:hypothetical protein